MLGLQKEKRPATFHVTGLAGGIGGIGSWHEPQGMRPVKREKLKLLLYGVPESRALVQRFAQAPATIQVTQHCFNYKMGLGLFRPFQLLLTSTQVINRVLQPEQIRLTVGHGNHRYITSPESSFRNW